MFDRGLTTGGSASEEMQKQIIKDNKHNGYFLWKGIRVKIQIRLMSYSIYVIWMLIMLYHKVKCCIRSFKIVFWIIPFGYCVPPIKL